MNREQIVGQFHDLFKLDDKPFQNKCLLRCKLIREEAQEVCEALHEFAADASKENAEHLLSELVDLQYVLSGTVYSLHYDDVFDEAFQRIHAANMSKVGPDGKPVYDEFGKVVKPHDFKRADLSDLVE